MLRAIKFTTEHTPEHVGKTRSSVLREMVAKARELTQGEEDLKSSLSVRRKEILAPKRMLLFKWLMEKSGSSDTSLFQDMCNGFDLTGTLPESHTFSKKFRPAHLPTETLRGVAKRARFALLSSVKSSGDHALDLGVYEATLKEQQKGFVVGPIQPDTLPDGATLTRRFGVQQKGKVRPIDDYRASLVNSAVTQPEAVSIHGVDHIAAMAAELLRSATGRGRSLDLVAKCWDLASAYKQVPLSDSAYQLDSFLVVYNPHTEEAEIYQQRVLPFGSVASVTAFLRCSMAIWHIGSSLLFFTWTAYFDDFLSICESDLARHTEICTSLLFQLLGWGLSTDKLVPYETCCKVLGIELDFTRSPSGSFEVVNTQARREELCLFIGEILEKGTLSRPDAERLRGRLQFASNHLFGRRFKNCLRELNTHISRGFKSLTPELCAALRMISHLLELNKPRVVDTCHFEWVHLYVDAAYEPAGQSGIGGLLLASDGSCLGFFSESVSKELVESIKRPDQKTVIFELEGLAVAIGLSVFHSMLAGKRVVIFTDNQAVQSCLIRCKSANLHMDYIVRYVCRQEERLSTMAWIERVPSQSNPSDSLSREVVESLSDMKRTRVDLLTMWKKCLEEVRDVTLYTGEWRDDVG
jgi:hypothetical protein